MKARQAAFGAIFVWALASAQQPVAQKPEPVDPSDTRIKVDVTRVNVLFTVTDNSADDFAVKKLSYEQIRRLVADACGSRTPMTYLEWIKAQRTPAA